MAFAALGGLARHGKVAAKNRVEDDHRDEIAEHPEASRHRQLGQNRHRRDQQDRQADGIGHDRNAAGHDQARRRFDGGLLFIAIALELFEKALAKLDRVTDRSSGDQKRHDQNQRLEIIAHPSGKSGAPDKRDHRRQQRNHDAV